MTAAASALLELRSFIMHPCVFDLLVVTELPGLDHFACKALQTMPAAVLCKTLCVEKTQAWKRSTYPPLGHDSGAT